MKIGIINNLYPPYRRGGTEVVVEKQVKELLRRGNDVFVITVRPLFGQLNEQDGSRTESGASERTESGASGRLKIYRFYPWNIFSFYYIDKFPAVLRLLWHGFSMFNLHSYFKIKHILKQEKPDLVYAHNLTGIGYLIPRLIKKMGIRYIQTIHDVALVYPSGLLIWGEENSWLNTFFLTRWWQCLSRYLFNSPDEVIFPSQWLMEFYQSRGFFRQSKVKVVKNFNLEIRRLNRLEEIKFKINFVYIGQVEEHKGILFLIKAISELRNMNYKLLIAGSGSKLERAKGLARDNNRIEFLGWQDRDKIKALLQAADYLIVPSLCYENSPTVIFESLQAGVPVIASNLGGIPELVHDGVNGHLFEAGNKIDLVRILQNCYN